MDAAWIIGLAASPWLLPALFALVVGDAFLVGEHRGRRGPRAAPRAEVRIGRVSMCCALHAGDGPAQ